MCRSLPFAVLVLGLALAAGCEQQAPAQAPMERPPAAVYTSRAAARDVPVYLDQIGTVVASESVSIQPQVSGRIAEVHFRDGADVKRGDLLFSIDPRPMQAELAEAEAQLAESQAELALAKTEFQRVEATYNAKAATWQEFETKKNNVAVIEARIQSDRAAIESAQLNLDYGTIRSPIDGRAGQRLVDVGNVVTSERGSMLMIQRLTPIYADFTVNESELTRVRAQMAGGALRTEVRLPDDERPSVGELTFLDNAVQEGSGTIKLRATLPNEDRHFWPGQFVRVRLVLETLRGAVLVPSRAVQIGQIGPFVYVVKADSTAEIRPVALGQPQGGSVVVSGGIAAGETVIVTGQTAVTPGGKVNDLGAEPAPGGPATQPAESEKR